MNQNEEIYLACYQTLLIYYFKERVQAAVPLDAIYSAALETTSRIYDGCFVKRKARFHYTNQVLLNDLERVHIQFNLIPCQTYQDAKPHLLKLLDEKKEVFMFVDEFYISYSLQYQREHINHSHMITDYEYDSEGKLLFHIIHNVGAQMKQRICEEHILERAFDALSYDYITYFEWNEQEAECWDKSYFMDRLKEIVLDYSDQYELFHILLEMGVDEWEQLLSRKEDLNYYAHTFGLLAGSRYCFLKALEVLGLGGIKAATYLTPYCEEAKILMFLFNKSVFSSKLDRERVQEKCRTLWMMNKELIFELKQDHSIMNGSTTEKGNIQSTVQGGGAYGL